MMAPASVAPTPIPAAAPALRPEQGLVDFVCGFAEAALVLVTVLAAITPKRSRSRTGPPLGVKRGKSDSCQATDTGAAVTLRLVTAVEEDSCAYVDQTGAKKPVLSVDTRS
jgi:hypothetical protein